MILIGQYDSAFVRRVGIALTLYEIPFEHRPWSTFGDAEKLRAINPLVRVPTLVLDDGSVLIDSAAMLDHLDSLVSSEQVLCPRSGPQRRAALKVMALAMGFVEKGVSLFYTTHLLKAGDAAFAERMRGQMRSALAALEQDRAAQSTPFWFGERMGHADISVAVAMRHMMEAHPGLIRAADAPAVTALCQRLEALRVFQQIAQPFLPPQSA